MKIRYLIISIVTLFILATIVRNIVGPSVYERIYQPFAAILLIVCLGMLIYLIIHKLCRTIYRAIKNKANQPEKSPLEP